MSILPSFLLSLELFSLLKPGVPLRYGTEFSLSPLPGFSINSAIIMEEQTLVAGSALITTGTKESNLTFSLGPVTTGGIISEIESPVPGAVKAGSRFNRTSSAATVSLPTLSTGKATGNPAAPPTFYSQLTIPHVTAFLVQCNENTLAGGSSITFGKDTAQVSFTSAGHITELPEEQSSAWFSLHPWEKSREVISTLYAGTLKLIPEFSALQIELQLDEAAGRSRILATDTRSAAEPDRWYSRTNMGIRLGPVSASGLFFISDYDFLTPKDKRILDTLKYGANGQLDIPCFWLTGKESFITVSLAGNRSLHAAEDGMQESRWQDILSAQVGFSQDDFSLMSTGTLADEMSTSTRLSFSGGGCFITTDSPFSFITLQELMNGTFGFHLTPGKSQKIQAEFTIKKAVLTKAALSGTLAVANCKNELNVSYVPADDRFSWSLASSAKW